MISVFLLAAAVSHDAYRPGIDKLPLTSNDVAIAACATRELSRMGTSRQVVLADGVAVDFLPKVLLGAGGDGSAFYTAEFHLGAAPYLRSVYRHPFSASTAVSITRSLGKACFPADWNAWAPANGEKLVKVK